METFARPSDVEEIKGRLSHPIIDGDGHFVEVLPVLHDFIRQIGGPTIARRFTETPRRGDRPRPNLWGFTTAIAVDHMTALLPKLQYERTEQLGLDFMVLYPTVGLSAINEPDDEIRPVFARAVNTYAAEVYREFRDKLEPVAAVPLYSPDEAIAELNYAVEVLGFKTIMLGGVVQRAEYIDGSPGPWMETVAHGFVHDFDPFWARCVELGVAPAFHGVGHGWGTHATPNYASDHIGSFAAAQEAACRSIIMGGVAQRFPDLRFSFLEGGITWAAQMYADTLGHYSKRNWEAVQHYNPRLLDMAACSLLLDDYATGPLLTSRKAWEDFAEANGARAALVTREIGDDFAQSRIESEDDIVRMFRDQFYFGCEADDPMNALAFNTAMLPYGARLNAVFASDVGHWDVRDMREVLPEAWELVEDGHINEEQFCDFTCGNVVRMLTAARPDFFDGTAVESAVKPFI